MKCNSFDNILKQIRELEKDELIAAVKAHGGLYRFEDDVFAGKPVITFDTADAFEGAADVEIQQVSVNDDGFLVLTGYPKDDPYAEIELDPDDVAPGHLHYVTEYIPETESVKDVTKEVTLEVKETRTNSLTHLRDKAANEIKALMRKHDTEYILATDINACSVPVVIRHPFDDNHSFTLDDIRLENDNLTFGSSSSCENTSHDENDIPLEVLIEIADWLRDNENKI